MCHSVGDTGRVADQRYRFDLAVDPIRVDGTRADVLLDAAWNVDGTILNGGYLQAVTTSVARLVLGGHADPVAVSTTFVSPPVPGPALVQVQVARRGRTLSSGLATLVQRDNIILQSLVTLADLPAGRMPAPDLPMPQVTPVRESLAQSSPAAPTPTPGLTALLDMAFVPEASAWTAGQFCTQPRVSVWLRFADGRELDTLALIGPADMAPPVCFAQGRFGWAPTMHLQVGVFAQPTGQWLLADLHGSPYDGPFVAEDCDMWDESGQLVARSRQLALPPRRWGPAPGARRPRDDQD